MSSLTLGNHYNCRPVTFGAPEAEGKSKKRIMEGTLVYIHPKRRFVTLEFTFSVGKVRESFFPGEVSGIQT